MLPFISGFAAYFALKIIEGKCSVKNCILPPIVECEECKLALCAYHADKSEYRCPNCGRLLIKFRPKEEKLVESFLRGFPSPEGSD